MSYILQHPNFGLGNFINLTPTISWLYQQSGERVPVFFSTDYVRQCFQDWHKIQILDNIPNSGYLFGSHLMSNDDAIPDYQFVFEFVTDQKWTPEFHTYVDQPKPTQKEVKDWKGCIVVISGSGNNDPAYVAQKTLDKEAYIKQMRPAKNQKIIAVGSLDDAKRNPWLNDISTERHFGDIRTALKIIALSDLVISNDTGLAHAAGAMNKNLIVLMKNTPRERVKNPGNTSYVYL